MIESYLDRQPTSLLSFFPESAAPFLLAPNADIQGQYDRGIGFAFPSRKSLTMIYLDHKNMLCYVMQFRFP